jgi:RHS repeat-associated protein
LDSAGNRTAKADELASVTTNYGYDAIYELVQAAQSGTTTENYSYDPVGNRTASLGVSSYATNSSNEMTANSNASYAYDDNGNTTSKTDSMGTASYTWDYENRLASVTLPSSGGTVTFRYDPFGRRIYKESPNATSTFVYDGDNLIETVNSSGGVVARYAQAQSVDQPLAMQRGSTMSYYEQDGLGSITSLTATNGSAAQSYTYDSFGNTTNSSGSLTNFFRYTGREFDAERNLYYYRARYYDPNAGRYLSDDPLNFAAGVNFYSYVGNGPVNLADPWGLCPLDSPCEVPNHPPTADVDINIMAVTGLGPVHGRVFQFVMVLPHMPWDYKYPNHPEYVDYGNFNFGATGAALGYSATQLLAGAGLLKQAELALQHAPEPPDIGPYGNQRRKDEMIMAGIRYFKAGCAKIFRIPL